MEKVALYARVSTGEQHIDNQIDALESWADTRGVEYEIFKDDGVSALADERPGFDYLMDRIVEFDSVVITELDRFGRSAYQLLSWAEGLRDQGVDLVVTKRSIDTSTTEGKLLFQMLSAFAEFERSMMKERMEQGFEQAKAEGRVGRPKMDLPVSDIVSEYEQGASVTFLANKHGVSRNTIYDRLASAGVT